MTEKMKITTDQLRSGGWIARPATGLGTVGWYPFPWEAVFATTRENAVSKFKVRYKEKIETWELEQTNKQENKL